MFLRSTGIRWPGTTAARPGALPERRPHTSDRPVARQLPGTTGEWPSGLLWRRSHTSFRPTGSAWRDSTARRTGALHERRIHTFYAWDNHWRGTTPSGVGGAGVESVDCKPLFIPLTRHASPHSACAPERLWIWSTWPSAAAPARSRGQARGSPCSSMQTSSDHSFWWAEGPPRAAAARAANRRRWCAEA